MDINTIGELNTMVLKLWENSEVGMFARISLTYVKSEKVNHNVWKMVLLFHKSLKLERGTTLKCDKIGLM